MPFLLVVQVLRAARVLGVQVELAVVGEMREQLLKVPQVMAGLGMELGMELG